MLPVQLAWEQLGTERERSGLWEKEETVGIGKIIPSLGILAYFRKLGSCMFWF